MRPKVSCLPLSSPCRRSAYRRDQALEDRGTGHRSHSVGRGKQDLYSGVGLHVAQVRTTASHYLKLCTFADYATS